MRQWKYILRGHEPVPTDDLIEWATWMDSASRRVAFTALPTGHCVDTRFIGLDHRLFGDGPPIVFETTVTGDGEWLGGLQRRCCTWEEAEAQHEAVVMVLTERFKERR
jgi:hypothetical protein